MFTRYTTDLTKINNEVVQLLELTSIFINTVMPVPFNLFRELFPSENNEIIIKLRQVFENKYTTSF